MLIHNVYFWLKDEVTEGERNGFEKGIGDFLSTVEEIQKFEVGIPASTPDRDVVDHTYGYSMFVWFNSVEDHNTYQTHAAHDVFVNSFKDLWARVQVLDSELL